MFELYNGHPLVNNNGDSSHISTEKMWDELLTKGMLIYGVSSDDAHKFQAFNKMSSNPGRGWVMVQADSLSPNSITNAMITGNFYASNGVILKKCESSNLAYSIEVDEVLTLKEINKPELYGSKVDTEKEGFL